MGEIDRIRPTFAPPAAHRGGTPYVASREGRRHGHESSHEGPADHLDLTSEPEPGTDGTPKEAPPAAHPEPPEAGLDLSA